MYKKIMIAFDGSIHSESAMEAACSLTVSLGAELHVFNAPQVIEDTIIVGYSTVPIQPTKERVDAACEEIAKQARAIVNRFDGLEVEFHFAAGNPGNRIVDQAKENDIDLIVLGRRGLGQFSGLLVGSTTTRVSQLADCAVLTVK